VATGEQLKALVKSHIERDEDRFLTLALQVAAHEARRGHGKLAKEIRDLIDRAKSTAARQADTKKPVAIVHPRGELAGLFSASYPKLHLSDMVLEEKTKARLARVLREQRARHKLRNFGLEPRRKLLLIGPPGSGKTMTAGVLAGELHLPLFVIRLDSLITKFMGETAAKLRLVFDAMAASRGVYLFDEFDSIGAQRALPNEVGEIRRVLNSFLQFIEHDESDSLILAATNHPDVLDRALFRRFDDVIQYDLPDKASVMRVLQTKLASFAKADIDWEQVTTAAVGRSYADITRACEEAAKEMVLNDRRTITTEDLTLALSERSILVHEGKLGTVGPSYRPRSGGGTPTPQES
jgi:SpoVK/Ycf46/Vps4 family AAA+-type ATPase